MERKHDRFRALTLSVRVSHQRLLTMIVATAFGFSFLPNTLADKSAPADNSYAFTNPCWSSENNNYLVKSDESLIIKPPPGKVGIPAFHCANTPIADISGGR
jgi:hypothetical protein